MATSEIHELLVRVRPEGAEETAEKMDDMAAATEEAAGEMQDATNDMERFSRKFKGAMNVAVAGLGIATAGLLSQVPVIREAFAGLGLLIDELALKLDETLRPIIGPLTDEFADLAEQISDAEGFLDALDITVERIADKFAQGIQIAIDENIIRLTTDEILTFMFPKLGKGDVLEALLSFDLSRAAVLSAIFGFAALAAGAVLSWIFGTGTLITAGALLSFVFTAVTTGAVLSHIFGDLNMTEGVIISALFAPVVLSASAIIAAVFGGVVILESGILSEIGWPIIAAGAILALTFAPVVITAAMIVNAIGWPNISLNDLLTNRQGALTAGTDIEFLPAQGGGGGGGGGGTSRAGQINRSLGISSDSGGIVGFQEGGRVPETGFALVHEGEFVEPSGGGGGGGGGGLRQQVERLVSTMAAKEHRTVLNLDSREVAKSVEPLLGESVANAGRSNSI